MSVYKRGETYWYDFWFNGSHIRDSAHTNSKTIAKQAEQQRRRDLERAINRITRPTKMPLFKIAANRLVEDKRARRAHNTGELYKYALKPVIHEFGGRLVCDISPEDIAALPDEAPECENVPADRQYRSRCTPRRDESTSPLGINFRCG